MSYLQLIRDFAPSCEQEAGDQRLMLQLAEPDPDFLLLRQCLHAHFTPSGLVFNPALDKVLLVHHNIYHTWSWTGGHADGNSDFAEVALREAWEETGLRARLLSPQIASLDVLPVFGHIKKGEYVSAHLHLCPSFLLVAEEEAPIVCPEENSGVAWFPLKEVVHASGEACMIPIYEKLISRAKKLKKESCQ